MEWDDSQMIDENKLLLRRRINEGHGNGEKGKTSKKKKVHTGRAGRRKREKPSRTRKKKSRFLFSALHSRSKTPTDHSFAAAYLEILNINVIHVGFAH